MDDGSRPELVPVKLDQWAARTMRAAAHASAGHEACGLLFGTDGHVAEASVAQNVAAEPWHRFEIDAAHLFDAHRRSREGPARLIGCWHSHPGGSAVPSARDRAGALDEGWLWLVLGRGGQIRGWRPAGPGFAHVRLVEVAPSVNGS